MQDDIQELLRKQSRDFHTSQTKKRILTIKQRYSDIREERQRLSDGNSHHPHDFKKANRQIDLFQPELPLLKFPQDTVLNTFDNTKRWLKELDIPDKKQYWSTFKASGLRHYKGQPFSYAPGVPDFLGPFIAYEHVEHEESQIDKFHRMKMYNKQKHRHKAKVVMPTHITPREFSFPGFDQKRILVEFNKIHDVKYIPGLVMDVQAKATIDQFRSLDSQQSRLNSRCKVKPFTQGRTRSELFQKVYKPLACQDLKDEQSTVMQSQDNYDFDI